jgi:adenylosuccinate lyase
LIALAEALAESRIAPRTLPREIERACQAITVEEVYEEERRIGHVVRALVNCSRDRISEQARPFVHLFATSNDITDTATTLRFKELTRDVLLPDLVQLEEVLIRLAGSYAEAIQIGRTHGKHAEPITFGFAMANYVARLLIILNGL